MKDKKKFMGLRRKILFNMVSLLLLLGLATAVINQQILFNVLKREFQNKGLIHARSISAYSLIDILTQDTSRLKKLLDNEKKIDPDTAYIFLLNSSKGVLAHTFEEPFPVDLINANSLPKNKDFNMLLLNTRMGLIYDIDVPIFLDKSQIGQVRLGILQNNIRRTIILIDSVIMAVAFFIIIIGMFLAGKLSSLITEPVSKLVQATESVQKGDFSAKIDIKSKDEIGFLAAAFNKMTAYLSQLMQERDRLTKYKEREKIALDLHDNCAQDLSDLIKRLELCEKLFKIEPIKAFEELKALKENIRGHLGKARHIIHGLKSEGEEKFILPEKLKEYIEEFKQYNAANIKLILGEALSKDIPADKARNIFYIITEALSNIKKHSRAKNIEVRLDWNKLNELAIDIKDDGVGFDVKEAEISASGFGKWGLMSMRQRAVSLGGNLAISSIPLGGSEVSIRIPLESVDYNI